MTDHLQHLANRAATDPFFLGHRLAEYASQGGLADEDLAIRLGCPVVTLVSLRLCRAPRNEADIQIIAERFGINSARLAELLSAQVG